MTAPSSGQIGRRRGRFMFGAVVVTMAGFRAASADSSAALGISVMTGAGAEALVAAMGGTLSSPQLGMVPVLEASLRSGSADRYIGVFGTRAEFVNSGFHFSMLTVGGLVGVGLGRAGSLEFRAGRGIPGSSADDPINSFEIMFGIPVPLVNSIQVILIDHLAYGSGVENIFRAGILASFP